MSPPQRPASPSTPAPASPQTPQTRHHRIPQARRPADAPPRREQVIGRGVRWLSSWSLRCLLIALGLILLGLIISVTWSILLPALLALLLSTVLTPVSGFLHHRLRFPRGLAAGVTLVGGIAVLIGAFAALAPSVAGQSRQIVDDASDGLERLQEFLASNDATSGIQVDNLVQTVQDRLSDNSGAIASGVLTGIGAFGSGVVTAVLALVLTFLYLKDGHAFVPMVRRLAGPTAGPHLGEVLGRSWRTVGGFIRTQALVSLIDAVLIGAALLIVGVPLAIPLAVLTFIAGFIPIAGAFVAGALAVLVALVSAGTTEALIILAVIVAVQQLEGNVLSPILQSKSMQLHPAVVLLAVALATTLFGIVGAFLAVPAAAIAAVVVRYLDEQVVRIAGEPRVPPLKQD